MCGIMLVLRAVFNMLVRNTSPRGPMCFRYLMFNLSGPCEVFLMGRICIQENSTIENTHTHTPVHYIQSVLIVSCL